MTLEATGDLHHGRELALGNLLTPCVKLFQSLGGSEIFLSESFKFHQHLITEFIQPFEPPVAGSFE